MFVHGGVADDDEYLGDASVYSIVNQKWNTITVDDTTPGPVLANHTCCLILPSEQRNNPKLNLYKLPEMRVSRRGEVKVLLILNYYLYDIIA